MAELDDQMLRDLARLRAREGPPQGAEDRVLAAVHTAIGAPGLASAGLDGVFAAKVIAATLAITGVGLLLVKLGATVISTPPSPTGGRTPVVVPDEPRREVAGPDLAITEPTKPVAPEPKPVASELTTRERPATMVAVEPNPSDDDPLAAELALLDQARATDDATERLRLLDRHRARFPTGILRAERDSLRITTLCELDRIAAAQTAAEQFLRAHPRSPLWSRMRSACPQLDTLALPP